MPELEWITIITAVSFILLVGCVVVSGVEQKRDRRIFAVRLRDFLDSVFDRLIKLLSRWYISITRHKMKLSWYYGIHAVLVAVLAFLAATYSKVENIVISNRTKAKKIRKEEKSITKSHLTEIAEHKVNVQLSPKEKTRRKDESMKGQ